MKITTKIVIDMTTNEVLEHEYFEYDGPLALCDGGGSGGDGGDAGNSDAGNESGGGSPLGGDEGDAGAPGMGGNTGGTGSDSGSGALGGGTGATGLGGADSGIGDSGVGLGGDSSAGMGDTGMGSAEGDSGLGDAIGDGIAAGADVGMGVDAAMAEAAAEAEAAAQSNLTAEMNSMSQLGLNLGFSTSAAKGGMTIGSAITGNPVAGAVIGGLAGLFGGSTIGQSDPSEAEAIGNLNDAGLAAPSIGDEGQGFGGTIGDNYGGGDMGGPGDPFMDTSSPTYQAPEENPPVVNPVPEEPEPNPPTDERPPAPPTPPVDPRDIIGADFRDRYGYSDLFRFRDSDYDIYIPELSAMF